MELREDAAQGALAHPTPSLLTLTTPTSSLHPHSPVPPTVLQCAAIVHDSSEQLPGAWARVDLSDLSLSLCLLHELQLRGEGSGPGRPEVVVYLLQQRPSNGSGGGRRREEGKVREREGVW